MILQGVVHVAPDGLHGERPLARIDPDRAARRERGLGRRALRERVRQGRRRLEVQQGALVPDVLGALLAGLAQSAAADGSAARRLPAGPAADRRLPVVSGGLSTAVSLREPGIGTLRARRLRSRRATRSRSRRRADAASAPAIRKHASPPLRVAARAPSQNARRPHRRRQRDREPARQLRLLHRQDALGRGRRSLRRRRHARDRPERRLRRQRQHSPLSPELEQRQARAARRRAQRPLPAPADRHRRR